jgi:predicted dienelactone hydrolase
MMKLREYGVVLCMGFVAVTARAAGIHEMVVPADRSGPQISALLWTPCATLPGPIMVNRGNVRLTLQGVKDCAPSSKQLPVIVISHGGWEDMFSHHDTAEFLADAGFAVVTFNHTQDAASATKDELDDISGFIVRPTDVERVISFVLSSSQSFADIDSQRIGFFGHSRGGYTGLVLAGAVPNFHTPPFPCPGEWHMCRQMRDNNISAPDSGSDPRIKAFVIADPVSLFPDKASLQKVRSPIQLWTSASGGMGVRPEEVASLKNNLPNSPEFHHPAHTDHFSFLFPCSADEAKAMSFQCSDEPGVVDRADFHRKFNAQMLKFFRTHL